MKGCVVTILIAAIAIVIVGAIVGETPSTKTVKEKIERYAYIEARDTCSNSAEYRQQVAEGATIWERPATGENIGYAPQGVRVGVVRESGDFTRIDYGGKQGYVQSYFLVDYDPSKNFETASGDTEKLLCTP